jgi:hypothetical protein
MKTLATCFALTLLLTMCGASTARAQSVGSLADYLNDYELYVAQYETNWYTIVTWTDGTQTEYRSYSQQGAQQRAIWLHLHLIEVADTEIVSRVELSEWEYVDAFGTYNLAIDEAIEWEADGYETDIRAIRVKSITPSPYRPISNLSLLPR